MVPALLTGVSYASIASRYPMAAGAAYAVQLSYRSPWLSHLAGLATVRRGGTVSTRLNTRKSVSPGGAT